MNLTTTGVDKTINNLNRVQAGITSEKPAEQTASLLEREAKKHTPVDTGNLRNSITTKVTTQDDRVIGVIGSNVKYAMAFEKGTRPHFPPTRALEGWARRHGAVAFLVARAISKRGTKGYFMFQKALEDNQRRVIQFFENYNKQITREANAS